MLLQLMLAEPQRAPRLLKQEILQDDNGEWNFVDDSTAATVYIDGKLSERVIFPIGFDNRRFLAFFDYTLEPGEHTIKLVADGERLKDYRFEMYHTILYSHQKP